MRILRHAGPTTLTRDGLSDPVTVTVMDANGDEIASEAATLSGSSHTYELANQTALAQLTVTWEDTDGVRAIDHVDVAGARLFTVAQARAFRRGKLDDDTKFPDATLQEQLLEVENYFEQVCNRSFIPRYGREVLSGDGRVLYLAANDITAVTAVTENGTDITSIVEWDPTGRLVCNRLWSKTTRRNIVVEYEYGLSIVPDRIRTAALILTESLLANSDVLDRAMTVTDETGTYRLSQPDDSRHPTGIPEVDAVLNRHSVDEVVA